MSRVELGRPAESWGCMGLHLPMEVTTMKKGAPARQPVHLSLGSGEKRRDEHRDPQ